MDYMLIIAVLAFFGAVQLCNKFSVGPVLCAAVAVIIPFLVSLALKAIYLSGHRLLHFENLFSATTVTIVVCQFLASLLIFRKLQEGDDFMSWFGWTIGGSIAVILVIPFVIRATLSSF